MKNQSVPKDKQLPTAVRIESRSDATMANTIFSSKIKIRGAERARRSAKHATSTLRRRRDKALIIEILSGDPSDSEVVEDSTDPLESPRHCQTMAYGE
jgi:hypothetical protein